MCSYLHKKFYFCKKWVLQTCIASRSSLGLCLMSSLSKGKNMGTKLVKLFANRVVERRNMINDYLSGRDCIESVRGS
jgi:hypothetical protein